jgi:hypothetical protein
MMGDCSDIKYDYDIPVWEKSINKTSWDFVKKDIDQREQMGYIKYGKYLSKHTDEDMLQHLYEELLDATVYIKTLLLQRNNK